MNNINQLKLHIGKRIKDLRLKTGLSIEELANEMGIAFPNYLYLEKGTKSGPRLETLCKVGDFYGVHLDYFFLDYTPPLKHLTKFKNNGPEDKLLKEFRKMNSCQQNFWLHTVKNFNNSSL
jgi:transcriptional regulator with XRE-family HTH domain